LINLDLVQTRDEALVTSTSQLPLLGKSDHCGIRAIGYLNKAFSVMVDCWAKDDFNSMSNEIPAIDWSNKLDTMDAKESNTRQTNFLLHSY